MSRGVTHWFTANTMVPDANRPHETVSNIRLGSEGGHRSPSQFKPSPREPHGLIGHVESQEITARVTGGRSNAGAAHEWITDELAGPRTLGNQRRGETLRLFCWVAIRDTGRLENVGNAEVLQLPLALLKEQDELVPSSVAVPHADTLLVPDKRLPKLEANLFNERFGEEHSLSIAMQVEVTVGVEHAGCFPKQLPKAAVGGDRKPLVAGRLALLEPGCRADLPMLLQSLVGRGGGK